MTRRLILASSSPRRQELLSQMGLTFTVFSPDVDENLSGSPESVVAALAQRKSRAAAERFPDDVVLAADTLVSVNGQTLGKPEDDKDAARMLRLLSGVWHQVHTGVCLIANGQVYPAQAVTQVLFSRLEDREIQAYVASGEPMGKAGAYAIQGLASMYIEEIAGSYTNVVGLPTSKVRELLKQIDLL